MYILKNVDFKVINSSEGESVIYKLTYEIDEFGLYKNRLVYIVSVDLGEKIQTKISEKELKEKYFKIK